MALSIGFRNSRELFDETSVTNMVAFVKKKTDAGVVKVASVDGAVTGKNEVEHLKGEALKKTESKRKALQAQIDELNNFILTGNALGAPLPPEIEETPGEPFVEATADSAGK